MVISGEVEYSFEALAEAPDEHVLSFRSEG
jgi:hypothetical protein